jgi:hypothetical protein
MTDAVEQAGAPVVAEADRIRQAIDARNERDMLPVPAGAIVVGDDGTGGPGPSLEFALDLAERLAARVVVVQSWTIDSSLGEMSDHHGSTRSFGEVTQALRTRLGGGDGEGDSAVGPDVLPRERRRLRSPRRP